MKFPTNTICLGAMLCAVVLVPAESCRNTPPTVDTEIKETMEMFDTLCQYGQTRKAIKDRIIVEMKKHPTKNLLDDENFPETILDIVMKEGIWGGMDTYKSEMKRFIKNNFHQGTLKTNEELEEILGKMLSLMREKASYEAEMAIEELKEEQKNPSENGNQTTVDPERESFEELSYDQPSPNEK
ncbi:hypothetical protein WDU94_010625 [Cyamophila willieti]